MTLRSLPLPYPSYSNVVHLLGEKPALPLQLLDGAGLATYLEEPRELA